MQHPFETFLIVLLAAWILRIVWLYTCAPSVTVIEYDSEYLDMLTTAELIALLEEFEAEEE